MAEDEATYRLRFGAVVTELRLARRFSTQAAFAEALSVHESTVQRWESGGTLPSAWDVRNLSRVLKVDPGCSSTRRITCRRTCWT